MNKLDTIISKLDQYVVSSLYSIAQSSKSTAIALAFILKNNLSIQEAVDIARVDENYQTKHFGVVEGAHDFD